MSRLEKLNERYFYHARFSVYRAVSFLRDNGITGQIWEPVEGMADLPCALSYTNRNALGNRGRMDAPEDGVNEVNNVRILAALFCNPAYLLQAGDKIVVEYLGKTTSYWAGEPFVYPYYQHLLLLESHEA